MSLKQFLMTALLELLKSPEIMVPLALLVLSYVPGKFKSLAEGIINVLSAKAAEKLEARTVRVVADAVAAAQQIGKTNEEKLHLATQHAVNSAGLAVTEAVVRVEAEVRRAKDAKARVETDFARVAASRMSDVLSAPAKLPVVNLE